MIYYILSFILGIIIGICILLPKTKSIQQLNKQTELQNIELSNNNSLLKKEQEHLQDIVNNLNKQQELLNLSIEDKRKNAEEYYKVQEELLKQYYLQQEEEYKQEYFQVLQDYVENFQYNSQVQKKKKEDLEEEIELLNLLIEKLRSVAQAAVETNKRIFEEENQLDFYRLILSDKDIEEIKKLREITPYLRDSEPLNKVIYKVYYEKSYTDLIGRVIGSEKKTGIYKITNLQNGMCYVGQAVDIAERWKQHIRRAVGADAPTNNKLYPVMFKLGPENFTFEIIEECERNELNEKEQYWQDFYKAKEFGYSIK